MPEGHTIHRLAQDHTKLFVGRTLRVCSPQGRFDEGAQKIDGHELRRIEAYGKHLLYFWKGRREALHIHLGLYGKFRGHKSPAPEPRGAVRLRMAEAEYTCDLNGPTACELLSAAEQQKLLARLGPDPLRADADVAAVYRRISGSRAAIGKLLLDQSVIAGVGNVYRAEVLHLLGIHPERAGKDLHAQELEALWRTLVQLLKIGVRYNRIITTDPEQIGKTRGRMNRTERLLVYKRERCQRCGSSVEHWDLGARTIYACVACQS